MSIAEKRQGSLVVTSSELDRAQARSHVLEQMEGRISFLVLPLWLIRVHPTRGREFGVCYVSDVLMHYYLDAYGYCFLYAFQSLTVCNAEKQ
jgi:hypothetical protein